MINHENIKMGEDFIHYLWQYWLSKRSLTGINGEKITVISPGTENTDSGPDIFNAMILIDKTRWAGNVEIHVNASDWYKHGHQNNKSYDNIILHLVYNADKQVYRNDNTPIPTVEIKNTYNQLYEKYHIFQNSTSAIPCSGMLGVINYFDKIIWFERLMSERLQRKAIDIYGHLTIRKNDLLQVFFQKLARGFGYKVNADAMEQLASSIDYKILLKHKDNTFQLEAILFGQSGLLISYKDDYCKKLRSEYLFLKEKYGLVPMNPENWKFMRMRPANFPTIRISQLANLISGTAGQLTDMLNLHNINDIVGLLNTSASKYWDDHYRFGAYVKGKRKKLGKSAIHRILINVIVPTAFVYGKLKNTADISEKAFSWLSQIPPEKNNIIREFEKEGLTPENASHSQALIELKEQYCIKKRCLSCRFGHIILSNDS